MADEERVKLEIPLNARVNCKDGPCARVSYIVINPLNRRVTDLVLRQDGQGHEQVLLPEKHVVAADERSVEIDLTRGDIEHLAPFVYTNFVEIEVPLYQSSGPYLEWPYVVPLKRLVSIDERQIPLEELAINRRAQVMATDGPVGRVDEFMIDPETGHVSHIVMREGHLWGARDVVIPVSAIVEFDESQVRLSLEKREIEDLPPISVMRKHLRPRAPTKSHDAA